MDMSVGAQIVLDKFKPRDYQKPILDAFFLKEFKRLVVLMPRRAGKDLTCWAAITIREAITHPGVYFVVYPTYSQGRKILWDTVDMDGSRFIDYLPKELIFSMNSQMMRIVLKNGSVIQVIGSDNPDRIVGTNPRGVVFSEYALQSPRIYALMSPILAANPDAWAIFISTPRGHNHFWKMYNMAKESPYWWTYKVGLNETRHVSQEMIRREAEEDNMSEDLIQQEYYCSFDAGIEGSYYCRNLDRMRMNNQICEVPWESGFPVHTAWDIGMSDMTSIIMFQSIGQSVRIIDYYENNSRGLEHYVKHLKSLDYMYGVHIAPHDIKVREWGTGMSRIEQGRDLGIEFELAPNIAFIDGVDIVRRSLTKIWIDKVKCKKVIKAIENYRREWDAENKIYKGKHLHDEHSHVADALRYLCLSLPKTAVGMTAEELREEFNRKKYGDSGIFSDKYSNSGIRF